MSIYVNVNFLWENGETRHRDEHRGSFRFASAWPAWLVPRVLPCRPALKHVLADMSLPRHKWNNIQWEFQDPYIGLIYGRYLQFGFLEWPLKIYSVYILILQLGVPFSNWSEPATHLAFTMQGLCMVWAWYVLQKDEWHMWHAQPLHGKGDMAAMPNQIDPKLL